LSRKRQTPRFRQSRSCSTRTRFRLSQSELLSRQDAQAVFAILRRNFDLVLVDEPSALSNI
jgi:hypothetical protein